MSIRTITIAMTGLLVAGGAGAGQTHDASRDHHSAYAEQAGSGIAGLSLREIEQLENGEGMGLARAAEMNRYPGPRHVLGAAEELGLSDEQRRETERIFDDMHAEAVAIGKRIIEKERILSQRFAHRHVDEDVLRQLTAAIARLQGELRLAHLRAHLRMEELLSGEQIARYHELRGYGSARDPGR
ncbi:MAG: Spy/CpxP family protein refolding chaperone [Thermoanaerobaculia bacterium]